MSLDRTLQGVWYRRAPLALFLLLTPLSVLFAMLAAARRMAYRCGVFRAVRLATPVVVVGNITVGGTGKTPLVIWIAEYLQARGCRVGIVTRGYGGSAQRWPQDVTPQSSSEHVGDEAVLLASRTNAIVVAGPDRVAAALRAIDRGAQIVVSDDGLQHYRLARSAEIAVLDAERGVGNGWLLPAGPLRESVSRLEAVDLVVETRRTQRASGPVAAQRVFAVHELADAWNLTTGQRRSIESFAGTRVHALAGIGNPEAFFAMLRGRGLTLDARALPDHARLTADDLNFADDAPVLMTEKDAVKCRALTDERHWVVRLDVRFAAHDERAMRELLDRLSESDSKVAQVVKS